MIELRPIHHRYADALYEICENDLSLLNQFLMFVDLLEKNEALSDLMYLDIFSITERKEVLIELCRQISLPKKIEYYLTFLVAENRFYLIPGIRNYIIEKQDAKASVAKAIIRGQAETLKDDIRVKIEDYLKKNYNLNLDFQYIADPGMVAGFVVEMKDLRLEISVKEQIEYHLKIK